MLFPPTSPFECTGVYEGFVRNARGKRRLLLHVDTGERREFKVPKDLRKLWQGRLAHGAVITLSGVELPSSRHVINRIVDHIRVLSTEAARTDCCERCPIRVCTKKNCWRSGGKEIWKEFERKIHAAGLSDAVELKPVGCLGNCKRAPSVKVDRGLHPRCSPSEIDTILVEISARSAAR